MFVPGAQADGSRGFQNGGSSMGQSKPITVLIVDDEDRFRITTTASLKKRGFEVIAASSGDEAVEHVRQHRVDVVVIDIKMPGMDGHETLRRIKKLTPEVEAIILTGYGSLDSALEGWREGVFAFLTKPSSIDFLAQRIREAFDKKNGTSIRECRVKDFMEPLSAFIRTIHEDQSVAEAVEAMRRFFASTINATKRRETLLRSLLVTDRRNKIVGVIGLFDLLRGLQPPCLRLSDDRSSTADSIYLEPSVCLGSFVMMVREMASRKVRDLMPERTPTIAADADLIEAANRLLSLRVQSLLVMDKGEPVGVLRDSDLFFAMADTMRKRPADVMSH
ncbi:MAG: response regulator [Candidatus Abyssobacteria bacterium SURF_5]|uniref:Response regulator n=1 Tax=Abyssobacteria bacterium (strain SURF_5) TaxID=2093360 RepID=A0A3A4NI86_ABYX5|nr:MAG: response regulator [Candidatus Abyssubacteria bacterium SURF_5]